MKVLVTGGAGYIGTELVRRLSLVPEVSELVVYDNLARETYSLFFTALGHPEKVLFAFGDLLDTRKLKDVLKGVDVVYHLAARVSTPFAREDSHLFEQVNHWGTAELSYLIENSDVQKVIYTSSASVYGFSDDPLVENAIPRPATHYGISKLNGENILTRLNDRTVLILRCGNVYGHASCLRFDAVINRFMFEAHYYNRISIAGSGQQYRSFVHIDLIAAVLTKLLTKDLPSGIYNLTHMNLTINEISRALKKIYPSLESLYIEQDLPLRSLLIQQNPLLAQLFQPNLGNLEQQLRDFRSKFSFYGGRNNA
jgi:UDP-glucose 4-epimerase